MMLIEISYEIILIIGSSIFLGEFELGNGVLDVFGVNKCFVEFRYDEYFILYGIYEF